MTTTQLEMPGVDQKVWASKLVAEVAAAVVVDIVDLVPGVDTDDDAVAAVADTAECVHPDE